MTPLCVVLALVLLVILALQQTLRINWIVWLTVNRGILGPNCFWWGVSDWFTDTSGANLYQALKRKGSFVPVNIFGTTVQVVTKEKHIKEILDQSPAVFGVGRLKYNFFKTFMKHNVGVSDPCSWKRRRGANEHTLQTNVAIDLQPYVDLFDHKLSQELPQTFADFQTLGKWLSTRLVFGAQAPIADPVFAMFAEANSMRSLLGAGGVTDTTRRRYKVYLQHYIDHPEPHSLVAKAKRVNTPRLAHQIPHWVFPIAGLMSVAVPRLLVLLVNHPRVLQELTRQPVNLPYLRSCILELFRLQNPVNSTFRTLLDDYAFGSRQFEKDTQFLILNNPVGRDPAVFKRPNQFIPERWTKNPGLEHSYSALMFNQGPQMCPGKSLAIAIMSAFMISFTKQLGQQTLHSNTSLNPKHIKQMINPCTLRFYSSSGQSR